MSPFSAMLAARCSDAVLCLGALDPMDHVKDGPLVFDPGHMLWKIGLTKQTFMFILAGALTLLFFWSRSRRADREIVPSRWGNFVESVMDFIQAQMTRPFLGHHGDKYVPLLSVIFVYILTCNLLGLVPFFDYLGHGSNTATGQLAITGALALCAFCTYHDLGIREQGHGIWGYLKNLFPHVPVFILPIIVVVELVAHTVRPCALAIRLFANMLAGHIMIAVILGFTSVFTPDFAVGGGAISLISFLAVTALMFLELLVAVIQAFVFTFLTTVFLAGAVHPEH
ncbi:MAG TPA: F0F1 ATP synthase subunit A [Planctomycetota bacterium]|nr:F0F1 ATP synthase subunit A [Planctomycetota bacterium]